MFVCTRGKEKLRKNRLQYSQSEIEMMKPTQAYWLGFALVLGEFFFAFLKSNFDIFLNFAKKMSTNVLEICFKLIISLFYMLRYAINMEIFSFKKGDAHIHETDAMFEIWREKYFFNSILTMKFIVFQHKNYIKMVNSPLATICNKLN